VEEVRPLCDVLVVLSSQGLSVDRLQADQVEGIDILISCKERQLLTAHETYGQTVLVSAGYNGEWLGRLEAQVTEYGLGQPAVQSITLGPEYADDEGMMTLLDDTRLRLYGATPTPEL
jgi:2',3'-cyclic-nucleotide 2'-phosphodiesterase (5'-nucleotidase family)